MTPEAVTFLRLRGFRSLSSVEKHPSLSSSASLSPVGRPLTRSTAAALCLPPLSLFRQGCRLIEF